MEENLLVCPDCGCALDFDYEVEGKKIFYCPDGDEEYTFVVENGMVYCECLWDGKRTCEGVYNKNWEKQLNA